MTDFDLKWSENSIKEYVGFGIKGRNVFGILPLLLCAASFLAAGVFCLVLYINSHNILALILMAAAVLFCGGIFIVINVLSKKLTKKISDTYSANKGLICSVSDEKLYIIKDNKPVNIIPWEDIKEISEGNTAFFLLTKEDLLIVLEKDSVLSGDINETKDIIAAKSAALGNGK